jgi:hypothetical protein
MMQEFIVISCIAFWVMFVIVAIILARQKETDALENLNYQISSLQEKYWNLANSHHKLLAHLNLKEQIISAKSIFINRGNIE